MARSSTCNLVHSAKVDRWSPALWSASSNAARAATTAENYHVRETVIAYSPGPSQDLSAAQLAATGAKRSDRRLNPDFWGKHE